MMLNRQYMAIISLRRVSLQPLTHFLGVSLLVWTLQGHLGLAFPPKSCIEPKHNLHSFSGDVTQWLTFWDSFKSMIHDNGPLMAVDIVQLPQATITGTALEVFTKLSLSPPPTMKTML